ncbi:unnamed protein product [Parnassius apollo]|uniref:(apollo) hypothetical protein n=1 Tax=Parnassius apollo TaxID=110799 RepID=A0A8S3WWU7_PARAO|nr:unnamed protein product [Parnassius apollo]
MTIDYYHTMGSPPCCYMEMLFVALGIESKIKYHYVDVLANDHLKPEYSKINPQHAIPTIVDDGFILWESHAVSKYLIDKYCKGNSLYPEDVKARAIVNMRLDFDLGTLYPRLNEFLSAHFLEGKPLEESGVKKIQEALGFIDTFLADTKYVAGSELTLADYGLGLTTSCIEAANISLKEYPNVVRWLALFKSTAPQYEAINGKHLKALFDGLKKK